MTTPAAFPFSWPAGGSSSPASLSPASLSLATVPADLLGLLPVVALLLTAEGVCCAAWGQNPVRAGWSREPVEGRPLRSLLVAQPELLQALARAQAGEEGGLVVTLAERLWEVRLLPQPLLHPSPLALPEPLLTEKVELEPPARGPFPVLLLAQDLTDRTRSEEALRDALRRADEAVQTKADLIATLGAEVRAPLSGVIGMAGLLLDTSLSAGQQRYAEAVRHAAQSLMGVVSDLLDYARLETGRLILEMTDFDLDEVLESAVDLVSPLGQEKELAIVWSVDPAIRGPLRGDAGRLRQILVHLLSNAIKFTPEGVIRLSVACEGGSSAVAPAAKTPQVLRFAVRDTGVGIAPGQQPALFEVFSRSTVGERQSVFSIGLAICKNLVAMMGGQIGVESAEGDGSTFWFTARFLPGLSRSGEAGGQNRLAGRAALLVDASEACSRLARWLEGRGVQVQTVGTALDALHRLAAGAAGQPGSRPPPDLLLVDHDLPDMTGRQLIGLLEQLPELTCPTPVLMIPAFADADSLASGGTVLIKPVGQTSLFQLLEPLLALRPETRPDVQAGAAPAISPLPGPAEDTPAPAPAPVPAPDAGMAVETGAETVLLLAEAARERLERELGVTDAREVYRVFLNESQRSLGRLRGALAAGDASRLEQEAAMVQEGATDLGCLRLAQSAATIVLACRAATAAPSSATLAPPSATLPPLIARLSTVLAQTREVLGLEASGPSHS